MRYLIANIKDASFIAFFGFILVYFIINLITSITLTFSIYSINQGLISILFIYFFGFYLILKDKIENCIN